MQLKLNWDRVGIMTSVICAIHCALLPLIITSLPVLGVNIIHNAYFEWGMIFLAYAVGSYSLYHGFVRHHRQWTPVILFTVGCVFWLPNNLRRAGNMFLLLAVILIISAHYMNYRLCHRSKCKSPHHSH